MYSMGTMKSRFRRPLNIAAPIRWDRHSRSARLRLCRPSLVASGAPRRSDVRAFCKRGPLISGRKGRPSAGAALDRLSLEDERIAVDHQVIVRALEPGDVHGG